MAETHHVDDSSLWTSFDVPPPADPEPPPEPPPLPPAFRAPPQAAPAPQQLSVLHHELVALVKRLELTPQEVQERAEAVEIIRDVAREIWPHAQVVMFGSSATGLAHCASDLDLVVCGSENRRSRVPPVREWLSAMKGCLKSWQLCSKVETVPNAKVPIVKCVLHKPKLAVDIAFFVMNGPQAVPFIRQQVQKYGPLRDLCLVLKCMLGQHGLQEVYTGGIGSYCLLNMIVAHLQKADPATQHDLGALLLGFLRRYDTEHNYATDVVAIKPGIRRNKFSRNWVSPQDPNLLSVEDPQNPSQDIGKASFRIDDVRALFARVRFGLEARWNSPGLIREVVDIDRDRQHLADGPILQSGNKKRKQGHAPWQGAAGGPAEPPPNKKRKQNVPLANQSATPFLPSASRKPKAANKGGMESARDAYAASLGVNMVKGKGAKGTTVDREAVERLLKPVKSNGTLDAWLANGRAESSPGIGVLRDGVGGGIAVRFSPVEARSTAGPAQGGVNGRQSQPMPPGVGKGGGWGSGGGETGTGVNKFEGLLHHGGEKLSLAEAIRAASQTAGERRFGLEVGSGGSAWSLHPTEELPRGMVRNGGLPNPGAGLDSAGEAFRGSPAMMKGGWKTLDEEGEGFVVGPLDGAGEGWMNASVQDLRIPERNKGASPFGKRTVPSGNEGDWEPWPGANVPQLTGPVLQLPLRADVMPASENKGTDEVLWARVVGENGRAVPKEEALAALRAQRKAFLARDATARALVDLQLNPYSPRVRQGFCQLARLMIRGGDLVPGVKGKMQAAVRTWGQVAKKLSGGVPRRVTRLETPVTWLPKPIARLDEKQRKVLRKAVMALGWEDGQGETGGGHVAAGEQARGGADVSGTAAGVEGSNRKAKKRRRAELRGLEDSGGVNGDARGLEGNRAATWQLVIGGEGRRGGAHRIDGSGVNGPPARRPDGWPMEQGQLGERPYVDRLPGAGVNAGGAAWGDVNLGSEFYGQGHSDSVAGGVKGGTPHWGDVNGAGANGAGVTGTGVNGVGAIGAGANAARHGNHGSESGTEGSSYAANGIFVNPFSFSGFDPTGGLPPGYDDRRVGVDTNYLQPQSNPAAGVPFVFTASGARTADQPVEDVRLGENLRAGVGQGGGSDFAPERLLGFGNGMGARAGSGASPRRSGHNGGGNLGSYPGQVPIFRGRSVVDVGRHVVGDALRY